MKRIIKLNTQKITPSRPAAVSVLNTNANEDMKSNIVIDLDQWSLKAMKNKTILKKYKAERCEKIV